MNKEELIEYIVEWEGCLKFKSEVDLATAVEICLYHREQNSEPEEVKKKVLETLNKEMMEEWSEDLSKYPEDEIRKAYNVVLKAFCNPVPDLAKEIYKACACREELSLEFIKETIEMVKLFDQKQHDYGSRNIAYTGEPGIVTRLNDKMARARNLVLNDREPNNESLDDTYIDIANYGVIALMWRKGKWK